MKKLARYVLGALAAVSICYSANYIYREWIVQNSSRSLPSLVGACQEFHTATEKLDRNFTLGNASNANLKSQYALSELLTSMPGKGCTFSNWPQLRHYIHDAQQCRVILINHDCDSVIEDYLGKISLREDLAIDFRLNNGKISQTNWNRLLFMYGKTGLKRCYKENSTNFCEGE